MKARARWVVIEDDFNDEFPLVIQDVGPWTERPTITNDVEAVVEDLVAEKRLPEGRRLFYVDSDGRKDEIVHAGGKFVRFVPCQESDQ